jgi:hypothetical protein
MTALPSEAAWPDAPDPLGQEIEQARSAGWSTIPQVGHGTCDNALIRFDRGFFDVVTIPAIGYSTVVRLQGGPAPGQPRMTGYQWWRHHVPVNIAITWVLTNPTDDDLLTEWEMGHDQ